MPRKINTPVYGLIVGGFTPGILLGLWVFVSYLINHVPVLQAIVFGWGMLVLASMIALPHAFLLGLPAYWLLEKLQLNTWWMSLIIGFAIGSLPISVFDKFGAETIMLGGFGMVSAFAAWLVWDFSSTKTADPDADQSAVGHPPFI